MVHLNIPHLSDGYCGFITRVIIITTSFLFSVIPGVIFRIGITNIHLELGTKHGNKQVWGQV